MWFRSSFVTSSIFPFIIFNSKYQNRTDQKRVSRLLKASRGQKNSKQRGGEMPPRCAVCKDMASVFEGGILSHKMTTLLILLRHRFLVYVSSHHQTVVLDVMPIPLLHQNPSGTSPVLRTAPPKNSPKNFWKGDNICHVFCAIIETKENTHA